MQRLFLNLLCPGWIDFRRANVLGSAGTLRIQKRVLIVKVVKTALWNYFKNRQGLITKNTYRQLATRHKFFYQQFAIVLAGLRHRRIKFARVFYNHHANGRTLSRRLYHQGNRDRWLLADFDDFPVRSDDVVLAKFFFRQNFVECCAARLDSVTGVRHSALFQNFLELTIFAESSVNRNERKIDIFRKREVFITNIANDTSRSDPGPPINTAIFFGKL